jgi:hypothetical protein
MENGMHLDWEGMFKRYVADDAKTPYMVPVSKLTRSQARNEIFVYTLFLAVIFGCIGVAALGPDLPHQNAVGVPLYAFSVLVGAVFFGVTKHTYAAAYCATAPVAALLYFLIFGFHPNLGSYDKVLLVVLMLLWLRYGFRVLAIAKAFPDMLDPADRT